MVVLESENTDDYGQVVLDDSQRIIRFEEKKQKRNPQPFSHLEVILFIHFYLQRIFLKSAHALIYNRLNFSIFPADLISADRDSGLGFH